MSIGISSSYQNIIEEELESQKKIASVMLIIEMYTPSTDVPKPTQPTQPAKSTQQQQQQHQQQQQQQQKKSSLNLSDYIVTCNRGSKRKTNKEQKKSDINGKKTVSPASSLQETVSVAKPPLFPSRRECAEQILGPVFAAKDMQAAAEYFLVLVDFLPKYMEQNQRFKEWKSKTDLNVLQVLIQSFLIWLPGKNQQHRLSLKQAKEEARLEQEKKNKEKKESENDKKYDLMDVEGRKVHLDCTSNLELDKIKAREEEKEKFFYQKKDDTHILSVDIRQKLIEKLIAVDFPVRVNIWKSILSALEWHGDIKMKILADLVTQATECGEASYCVLYYCIANPKAAIFFTEPRLILVTLLLGSITANMVEIFASNRDVDFRATVKSMLIQVESLFKSEQAYFAAVQRHTHKKAEEVPSFKQFRYNVFNLMTALRNEQTGDNLIAQSWAFRSLNTAAYNCYVKKSCLPEQLDDLICTIIHQRPNLKYYMTNLLQKKYGDTAAANRWNCFKFDGRYTEDFDEVSFHLNEGYLSLPEVVQVYFIDTAFKMLVVEDALKKCLKSDFPVVGLDSEWSAYASRSRASILQIAFEECVCILDLDQLHAEPTLIGFFDRLFLNKNVLKIGFQFDEDMLQIRARVRNCLSLFRAENVVCIQQLLTQSVKSRVEFFRGVIVELSKNDRQIQNPYNFLPRRDQYQNWEKMSKNKLLLKSSECTHANFNVEQFLPAAINIKESDGAFLLIEDDPSANESNNSIQSNASNIDETVKSLVDTSTAKANGEVVETAPDEAKDIETGEEVKSKEELKKNIENLKNVGLSSLCKRILGAGLDKQEQCSVWTRRPLRPRQLRYAALDAYCLLQIYRRCMDWANNLDCDIQQLLQEQVQ